MEDVIQNACGGFVMGEARTREDFISGQKCITFDVRRERDLGAVPRAEAERPPEYEEKSLLAWSIPLYMPVAEEDVAALERGDVGTASHILDTALKSLEGTDRRLRDEGKYLARATVFVGTAEAFRRMSDPRGTAGSEDGEPTDSDENDVERNP
jgi:hypothetical protein